MSDTDPLGNIESALTQLNKIKQDIFIAKENAPTSKEDFEAKVKDIKNGGWRNQFLPKNGAVVIEDPHLYQLTCNYLGIVNNDHHGEKHELKHRWLAEEHNPKNVNFVIVCGPQIEIGGQMRPVYFSFMRFDLDEDKTKDRNNEIEILADISDVGDGMSTSDILNVLANLKRDPK